LSQQAAYSGIAARKFHLITTSLAGWLLNFHLHDKIKLIAEFAAKENLKSSFPLRFKAKRAEGNDGTYEKMIFGQRS